MKSHSITLRPGNRVINLPGGSNLFGGLCQPGIFIYSACGGKAKCGKCKVKLIADSASPPLTAEERDYFTPQEIAQGLRLSCCLEVQGPMELEIIEPELQSIKQHAESYLPPISPQPVIKKTLITIPAPSLKNKTSLLERIEKATGATFHPWYLMHNLAHISSLAGNSAAEITAVLIDQQITALETGDTTDECYALAVDIGTTMLDASLINLKSGREVGALAVLNPQWSYGTDVLSRISSCQNNPQMITKLQQLIVEQLNSLLKQFAQVLDIKPESIYQVALTGNSTMLHLFAGVNPRSIGQAPYVPTFSRGLQLKPADCGIEISAGGEVFLLPSVSAYIGADILAGILVSRLAESPQPTLFIDLGTNGEVVLSTGRKMLATSCAAGPALEGMNISCGMPALPGAIEQVFFEQELEIHTIDDLSPRGLCGSAVIDLAAEMVRCGAVDKGGKIVDKDKLRHAEYSWLAEHITEVKEERAFTLYRNEQGYIYFSQTDFRQIQLARGAICSAIEVLLTEAKLSPADIERFIIGGRFGKSIRAESFKQLGIIPAGFNGRIDYVGNSSKAGAMMVLINCGYREEAEKIRRLVQAIELSTYPGYERILMEHLRF